MKKGKNIYPAYTKIYKPNSTNIFRIFPGDLTGSPDDFFLGNYLNNWRFL